MSSQPPMDNQLWQYLVTMSKHDDKAVKDAALTLLMQRAAQNLADLSLDNRAIERWWAGYYHRGAPPTIAETARLTWSQIACIITNVRD